ncbi:hypothetical protein [Alkaliphilus crotonatoxidans]
MEILSPGEKIKRLRKSIGLRQDHLTNEEITRSLVSMIENNKRPLTHKAALIIADALNQYYKNLGKKITPEYLMESETEQAEKMIHAKFKKVQYILKKSDLNNEEEIKADFNYLIKMSRHWNLESTLAYLLWERGQFFYNRGQYNQGLDDFLKAIGFYLRENQQNHIYTLYCQIGSCHYHLALYEQALLYYDRAYELLTEGNVEYGAKKKMKLLLDQTLCYSRLKRFDKILNKINDFKELNYYSDECYSEMLLIEANTHRDLGNMERASMLYDKLMTKFDKLTPEIYMQVNENYAVLHKKNGDTKTCLQYLQQAQIYGRSLAPENMARLLYKEAKCLVELNQIQEAIERVKAGIGYAAEEKVSIETRLELHRLLIDIQLQQGNRQKAYEELTRLEDLIGEREITVKELAAYACLIGLHCRAENYLQCLKYANLIHQYNEDLHSL